MIKDKKDCEEFLKNKKYFRQYGDGGGLVFHYDGYYRDRYFEVYIFNDSNNWYRISKREWDDNIYWNKITFDDMVRLIYIDSEYINMKLLLKEV